MSKNSIGVPPYQLSCGHRPSSYYAARHLDEDDDDNDVPIRYVRKTPHYKPQLAAHNPNERSSTLTKIKIAGKTKTVIKQVSKKQELAKVSKKTSVVSKKSNTKISKATTAFASSKSTKKIAQTHAKSKKSEKAILMAKANTHGKGYYSPDSKAKKSSASANSKGKSYYKPDSSNKTKTATKTNSKSNRKSKKKS